MPRRTITVAEGFDRAVRSYQARMILDLDRDVTYTEALNVVLAHGFLQPGRTEPTAFWKVGDPKLAKEDYDALLKGFVPRDQLQFEGLLDNL